MNRRSKNTPFSMDSLVASIDYIQISCHGTAPHFGANLCGLRGGIAVLALPQQPSDQRYMSPPRAAPGGSCRKSGVPRDVWVNFELDFPSLNLRQSSEKCCNYKMVSKVAIITGGASGMFSCRGSLIS